MEDDEMKVLVVHDGSRRPELKQIESWLKAAGCEVLFFDLTVAEHEKSMVELIKDCDVVLFLVTPDLPMAEAQVGILGAKGKGKKIVGVQLGEIAVTKEFGKYASALVPFSQDAVIGNVCGDQTDWTTIHGEKRPERKTKRHKC
jgi:hypothetical protein